MPWDRENFEILTPIAHLASSSAKRTPNDPPDTRRAKLSFISVRLRSVLDTLLFTRREIAPYRDTAQRDPRKAGQVSPDSTGRVTAVQFL